MYLQNATLSKFVEMLLFSLNKRKSCKINALGELFPVKSCFFFVDKKYHLKSYSVELVNHGKLTDV